MTDYSRRGALYSLLDNIIGYDDGVTTPGERLGKGLNSLGAGLLNDPVGLVGGLIGNTKRDLDNLMFEGGARERPEAVLGYAAAPMAPMSAGLAKVPIGAIGANAFNTRMRNYHHGQSDQTLELLQDGTPVGNIDYSVYAGDPAIQMIDVAPEYRRQGHASDGLRELQRQFPDREIDWGSLTRDGSKLYEKTDFVDVDQTGGILQILPEIEARAKAAELAYLDTFKDGYSGDAKAVREAYYRLDDELETAREMAARPPKRFINTAQQPQGIRAYHGSPHDFDRFSMDKIGTGEGAQAYGHGLYFAENEGVAKGYRDRLSDPDFVVSGRYDGPSLSKDDPIENLMQMGLGQYSERSVDSAIKQLESLKRNVVDDSFVAKYDEAISRLRDSPRTNSPTPSMYEVNINADPADFLDWDAPLSEQPAWAKVKRDWDENLGDPDIIMERLGIDETTATGRQYLNQLAPNQGAAFSGVSEKLRDQGIPGIKYRDAGSRGMDGETGTRNFVVFDENLIEIVRKYGIAGAAAMLGVTAAEVEAAVNQPQGLLD